MSDAEKFQEFLSKLQEELDKMLNPPEIERKQIGFACFIFSKEDSSAGAYLISNSERKKVLRLLKVYREKLRLDELRSKRRKYADVPTT